MKITLDLSKLVEEGPLVSLESLDRLFWPVRWRTRDRRALG